MDIIAAMLSVFVVCEYDIENGDGRD